MNLADLGVTGSDLAIIIITVIICGTYLIARFIQFLIAMINNL